MTLKTRQQTDVEFVATSSRVLRAWKRAAIRNRKLGRCARMTGPIRDIAQLPRVADDRQVVVLSHAEDAPPPHGMGAGTSRLSHAFHLLFTEPATHPEQVAQWMRTTGIRSEQRLHVVQVEDLEGPQVSELLGRISSAFGPDTGRGGIVDAYLSGDALVVRGPRQRVLHAPIAAIPALRDRPERALRDFRIDPDGSFIHWPELDVHLGWHQLLQAVDPAELHKAQQRSAAFNKRYGAAIRKLREDAGIPQSRIPGLTDRQVRRIEQGECRATASALTALAKAHGLDVNRYMDQVAHAIN